MADVVFAAGEEVVEADDVVAVRYQTIAKMRTQEAGAAGDEGSGAGGVVFHLINSVTCLTDVTYLYLPNQPG